MTLLLAIDPGVHHHGLALFDGPDLIRCAVVRGPAGPPTRRHVPLALAAEDLALRAAAWVQGTSAMPTIHRVVAELPQDRGQARVPPGDLIALSCVLGWTLGALGCPATLIRPSDWKGSTPKEQHQPRIITALSPAEAALLPAGALAHNAIDAVGIGLWALGRISGGRKHSGILRG